MVTGITVTGDNSKKWDNPFVCLCETKIVSVGLSVPFFVPEKITSENPCIKIFTFWRIVIKPFSIRLFSNLIMSSFFFSLFTALLLIVQKFQQLLYHINGQTYFTWKQEIPIYQLKSYLTWLKYHFPYKKPLRNGGRK